MAELLSKFLKDYRAFQIKCLLNHLFSHVKSGEKSKKYLKIFAKTLECLFGLWYNISMEICDDEGILHTCQSCPKSVEPSNDAEKKLLFTVCLYTAR